MRRSSTLAAIWAPSAGHSLESGVGFVLILGGFMDPILNALLAPWSNMSIFVTCLFPGFGFNDFLV